MSNLSESEIIRRFRDQVERERLTDNVKLICRIAGGMPSERVEEEFRLSGGGKANVFVWDALRSIHGRKLSIELDQAETSVLFKKIGSGLDSLVPRSEASFLPDSLIGSITIEVDKEETTLYFLADEEERLAQNKFISPQMTEAIRYFRGTLQRLIKMGKEEEQ